MVSHLHSIGTGNVEVLVDAERGVYSVLRHGAQPILVNAAAAVEWSTGVSTSDAPNLHRLVECSRIADALGQGDRLTLTWMDPEVGCQVETVITIYEGLMGFTVEAIVTNTGESSLVIRSVEPCRAVPGEGGCLYLPDAEQSVSPQWARVLRNGYLYSDPGQVEVLDSGRPVTSCWVTAVRSNATEDTLVAGYLRHDAAESRLILSYDMRTQPSAERQGLEFHARSDYGVHVEIAGGQSTTSGPLLVTWADDPDSALQTYGRSYATVNGIGRKDPLMGWCSWYYTMTETSEEEILENARFIAEHLREYGLDVVQIDDGYQRDFGDWEGNERFPHGMRWLAQQIHDLGLRAGIWVAPYVIGAQTEVAREHPDWLGVTRNGQLKQVQNIYGRGGYALDPTVPGARQWLCDQFHTIAHEWGYDMVKVDFVEWSVLGIERYRDPAVGRAGAYRLGQGAIRTGIGPDRHILDCGPLTAAGICDSWRIELDFDELNWRQYTKEPFSNVPAIANRYYFHNHLWSNDPDHLGLALLTDSQAQAIASVMALSGGTIISGDKLSTLPSRKLEILKSILPAHGHAARPLGLFGKTTPTVFHLHIARPFGSWHVLGVFNWDENSWCRQTVNLSDLGLDAAEEWVAFGFWNQMQHSVESGRIVLDLPPGSCEVLAIRRRQEHPFVIGSDRHVLQGAVELEAADWDDRAGRLSCSVRSVKDTRSTFTVQIPAGYQVKRAGIDEMNLAVGQPRHGLLRVSIPFTSTGRRDWWVEFDKIVGA